MASMGAGAIVSDSFEDGNYNGWEDNTCYETQEVTQVSGADGDYALHLNSSGDYCPFKYQLPSEYSSGTYTLKGMVRMEDLSNIRQFPRLYDYNGNIMDYAAFFPSRGDGDDWKTGYSSNLVEGNLPTKQFFNLKYVIDLDAGTWDVYYNGDKRVDSEPLENPNEGLGYIYLDFRAEAYFDNFKFCDGSQCNQAPQFNSSSVSPDPPLIGQSFDASYNVTDPDGTIQSVLVEVFNQSGTEVAQVNNTYSSSTVTDTVNDIYTPTSNQNYTIYFTATDNAGAQTVQTIEREAVDVTPPNISYNPSTTTQGTYSQDWIFVNVSATDNNALNSVTEEFNNVNSSFNTNQGNNYWTNHTALSDGTYNFQAFAEDTSGNINNTQERTVTLDTTVPTVNIVSPENITYNTSEVDLNVTSDEAIDTWKYSLDGGANQTFTPNTTINGLSDASHTVDVYATDSAGNTGSASQTFTVDTTTYIQINESVQINQSANKAFINVTNSLNVSNLAVYSDATNFGGINWSINGDTADRIDVKLSYFNDENPDDTYLANYSVSTAVGNVVTSSFVPRPLDSVYQVSRDGTFFKQVQADAQQVVDFGYEQVNTAYRSFAVKRTDQFRPEINSTTYNLNQQTSTERLEFVLWARNNSNDIASSSGTGTRIEFTNTSMVYDISLPLSSTYSVTDTEGLTRNRFMDLSKSDSGVTGDESYSHTLESQRRTQQLNITNNGDTWTLYNWTSELGQEYTGNITTGSTETITDTETSDFINNQTFQFTPVTSEIVLGFNYTGQQPLEIENTVGNGFNSVSTSGGTGQFTECSQINNTEIDVAANELKNYSVGYNCNPGTIGTPSQTIQNISDDTERIYYNSTDMQINTNLTENNPIVIRANKTNLKNPDNRDGGSLQAYVEGISSSNNTELNVTDTGSFFRVTVGTNFQASSLHTDDTDWSVTYTLSGENTTTIIDGGGGGEPPGSDSQVIYFGSAETQDGLETVSVPFGEEVVRNMTVTNERQSPTQAQVFVGDNGVCQYINVQRSLESDQFGNEGTYDLPAATQTLGTVESTEEFRIRYNLPNQSVLDSNGITDYSCEFETGSSYGTAEPLNIQVEEGFDFFGLFDLLGEELCFSIPVDSVSSNLTGGEVDSGSTEFCLAVWQIAGLLFVVLAGLYVVGRRGF